MAVTSYGLNDAETVKLWSRKLFHEALKQTWASKFFGKNSNSLMQIVDDTSKGPGDRVRVTLRMLLSGDGVQGDGTQEGNEEKLTTYTDDLVINQLRHAVRSGGKMSEQRIPFSVREEARLALVDWWADRLDASFMNQLAGNTGQTDTKFTGNNSTTAPDTNHIVYAGSQSSEASLTASDVFSITLIDACVEKAKTLTPQVRPIKYQGGEYHIMFLHPYQVYDLRTNATAGEVTWYDAQKARIQGGQTGMENPIFSGALGVYNGVILHESTRVPSVTANTRRAIFCGAQAGTLAFGRGYGPSKMSWVEELFDYKNQLGVAAGMIFGMKKSIFNSTDFATIVASTYAVAH